MADKRYEPKVTEAEFADKVILLAHTYGWKIAHFGPARTAKGWRTPVRVDGKGFPDFVMVHPARQIVMFVELKQGKNALTEDQRNWAKWLLEAGAKWQNWWPTDWPDIVRIVTDGKAVTTP